MHKTSNVKHGDVAFFDLVLLLLWMLSFSVLVVCALLSHTLPLNDDYQRNILIAALINAICVIRFMSIGLCRPRNGGDIS